MKHISSQAFTGTELALEQSQCCAGCAGQSPGAFQAMAGTDTWDEFPAFFARTQQRGSSFFSEQFLLTKNHTRPRNNWLVNFRHSWPCPFWTKKLYLSLPSVWSVFMIWPLYAWKLDHHRIWSLHTSLPFFLSFYLLLCQCCYGTEVSTCLHTV